MLQAIIKSVYEKVQEEKNGRNKTTVSKFLSVEFQEKYDIIVSDKSYLRYYNKYVEEKKNNAGEPGPKLIKAYCNFLGYADYKDYIEKNKKESTIKIDKTIHNSPQTKIITPKHTTIKNPVKTSVKKLNLRMVLSFLGILALIIYIFSKIQNFHEGIEPAKQNIVINIENFNADKNYYFYRNRNGKINLVEDVNVNRFVGNSPKPVTNSVLNTYFYEQGIDTTSIPVIVLKANYFDKKKSLIVDEKVDVLNKTPNTMSDLEMINATETTNNRIEDNKPKDIVISDTEPAAKIVVKPIMYIVVNEENGRDSDMYTLLKEKYRNSYLFSIDRKTDADFTCKAKTQYTYSESKIFAGKKVCLLVLDYQILKTETKTLVESEKKEVKAIGFSEQSAKENAIKKMKYILK